MAQRSKSAQTGEAAFWAEQRVLVTGAAGSVGAALCRRLAQIGCRRLGLLDHFDHGLLVAAEQASRLNPDLDIVDLLGDVRDRARLSAHMQRFAPNVVIHAAALKHVHLGERHPGECVLTNLVGARNALAAACEAEASDFLLVSSDKAAAPVCVMGAAKRLAELHLRGFVMERAVAMRLKAVRFGNVLGSQGSVEPRFAAQIAAGGPVEVTHPDMERYFMSSDQAVEMILRVVAHRGGAQAGAYVMDMGEPTSILALSRAMIAASGRNIDIAITGLRPGEKLREELFDAFESVCESGLAGVYEVAPASPDAYLTSGDVGVLEEMARGMDDEIVRHRVFAFVDGCLGRAARRAG